MVVTLKPTRYEGKPVPANTEIEVDLTTEKRWVKNGIAMAVQNAPESSEDAVPIEVPKDGGNNAAEGQIEQSENDSDEDEEPALEEMDLKELKEFAKEKDIDLKSELSKDERKDVETVRNFIKGQL